MLNRWMHHYNWHRPYLGIGGLAPVSRLGPNRNSLATLHNYTVVDALPPFGLYTSGLVHLLVCCGVTGLA